MKKFLAIILLTVGVLTTSAQSFYLTNNLAASNHTIFTSPKVVSSITFSTTNTTAPTVVYLYDGWLINTNAAYRSIVKYQTNIVTSYITSTGVTNQMTNTMYFYDYSAVSAANTANNPAAAITLPASASEVTVWTPDSPLLLGRRLTLSNSLAGLNAVISYRNP